MGIPMRQFDFLSSEKEQEQNNDELIKKNLEIRKAKNGFCIVTTTFLNVEAFLQEDGSFMAANPTPYLFETARDAKQWITDYKSQYQV